MEASDLIKTLQQPCEEGGVHIWDQFVTSRIFEPLGMAGAVSNCTLVRGDNHVARHQRLGPPVIGMGPLQVVPSTESAVIGPAGGINVSVAGIVPWLKVQLARGALPDGRRLWSEAQAEQMWTPQTIVSSGPGPTPDAPQQTVLQGYALGWGVSDYRGQRMLSHSGGLIGAVTRTTLLPELGIGFVVYSNFGDGDPVSGLRYALMDHLMSAPPHDWIGATRSQIAETQAKVEAVVSGGEVKVPPGGPSLALDRYVGRYRDPWYGDILIALKDGRLFIDFTHTPVYKSPLAPFGPDAFRTFFPPTAGENAVVSFHVKDGAVTGVTMKALSPIADFSFDFHDLAFTPVRG